MAGVNIEIGGYNANIASIGKYSIVGILGRGGIGYVLEAVHPDTGEHCAMKTAFSLGDNPDFDNALVEMVLHEEEAALDIGPHPHIVPFIEGGFVNTPLDDSGNKLDVPCNFNVYKKLVPMELPKILKPRDAANVCAGIASAGEAMHEKNWVHRDIKPANIMICEGYHAYLIDFGLAYKQGVHREIDKTMQFGVDDRMAGTPCYFSPDQTEWLWVGSESDVYNLGAALYEFVTGKPPHEARDAVDAIYRAQYVEVVPPRRHNRKIPIDLNATIMRMLSRDAERRGTMTDARAELEKIANAWSFSDIGPWIANGIAKMRRKLPF